MEAPSTPARGGRRKRALELHGDGGGEPAFVAGADGAYNVTEMPRRLNCGHAVDETHARIRAVDLDDERVAALLVRIKSVLAAMIRDMNAAAAAHPPPHPSVA